MVVTVVGLGSMGRRYQAILSRMGHEVQIHHQNDPWASLRGVAAIICNPTYLHMGAAVECARRGLHVLIEKPLDCRPYLLPELLGLLEEKGLTACVAYPFRHNLGMRALREWVACEQPSRARVVCRTDLRQWGKPSYSFDETRGGGVLWELSHELDYAEFLFGEIRGIEGEVERKALPVDDTARLVLKCDRAGVEVELSLCSREEERYVEFGGIRYAVIPDEQMYSNQVRFFLSHIGSLKGEFERQVRFWERLWRFKEGENNERQDCKW